MRGCPYTECHGKVEDKGTCSACGRPTKLCRSCGARVRVFSSFCRFCGNSLPLADTDWVTCKGSPERLGISRCKAAWSFSDMDDPPLIEIGHFSINGPCHSLLSYDGHIFAFSTSGSLVVVPFKEDGALGDEPLFFNLPAQPTTKPAIHNGSLYVTSGQNLLAYTLSDAGRPAINQRWRLDFNRCMPISAILTVNESIYLTLTYDQQLRNGAMIRLDGVSGLVPAKSKIFDGLMPSAAACYCGTDGDYVFFLAAPKDPGNLYLAWDRHSGGKISLGHRPISNAPSVINPTVPIALRHGQIFAVFGDSLFRIEAARACVIDKIAPNSNWFSLTQDDHALAVRFGDVVIWPSNTGPSKQIPHGLAVHSQPLLLGNGVAVMGLGEKNVWLLDIATKKERVWRAPGKVAAITNIASLGDLLLIGDSEGAVTVARFNLK